MVAHGKHHIMPVLPKPGAIAPRPYSRQWSPRRESNPRPVPYEGTALPAELQGHHPCGLASTTTDVARVSGIPLRTSPLGLSQPRAPGTHSDRPPDTEISRVENRIPDRVCNDTWRPFLVTRKLPGSCWLRFVDLPTPLRSRARTYRWYLVVQRVWFLHLVRDAGEG